MFTWNNRQIAEITAYKQQGWGFDGKCGKPSLQLPLLQLWSKFSDAPGTVKILWVLDNVVGSACKGLHLLGRIMDEFICLLLWMFWTRLSPRLLVRMGDNLSLKVVGRGSGGARSWTLCGRVIWVCSLPSVCFGGWRCGMWKQRLILPLNPSKIWCELWGKKHGNQGCESPGLEGVVDPAEGRKKEKGIE